MSVTVRGVGKALLASMAAVIICKVMPRVCRPLPSYHEALNHPGCVANTLDILMYNTQKPSKGLLP